MYLSFKKDYICQFELLAYLLLKLKKFTKKTHNSPLYDIEGKYKEGTVKKGETENEKNN